MTNEELVMEYQDGNFMVLDELMQQNEGLVKYFANKYLPIAKNTPLGFDDLEQEGWIAFLDAVNKYRFNDEEPAKFATYAGMVIKYKILRALNRVICRINKKDMSSDSIIPICSINSPLSDKEDFTIEDTIKDYRSELAFRLVEEELDNEILRKDLFNVIESVLGKGSSLINNVLIMHYGLIGKARSLAYIAEIYQVSDSWVQEVEYKAIHRIRNSEQGKALMQKYKWMMINSYEQEKREVKNQFASQDTVLERIETIDQLIYGVLKACC